MFTKCRQAAIRTHVAHSLRSCLLEVGVPVELFLHPIFPVPNVYWIVLQILNGICRQELELLQCHSPLFCFRNVEDFEWCETERPVAEPRAMVPHVPYPLMVSTSFEPILPFRSPEADLGLAFALWRIQTDVLGFPITAIHHEGAGFVIRLIANPDRIVDPSFEKVIYLLIQLPVSRVLRHKIETADVSLSHRNNSPCIKRLKQCSPPFDVIHAPLLKE